MNSNPENRDKTRFEHETKVTLEKRGSEIKRDSRMYNYSARGLYIESNHLLEPNLELRIGIANSPYAEEPDRYECYRGVVKWRKNLTKSIYHYGYGIEFLPDEDAMEGAGEDCLGSRRHQRKEYTIPVKYTSGSRTYDGVTGNVSSGGVFIKTQDSLPIGQQVAIDLPLAKKRKTKRLNCEVTWSSRGGFGAKFIRDG